MGWTILAFVAGWVAGFVFGVWLMFVVANRTAKMFDYRGEVRR